MAKVIIRPLFEFCILLRRPLDPELTKAEELSQSLAEGLTEGNNIWLTAFDFGGISTALNTNKSLLDIYASMKTLLTLVRMSAPLSSTMKATLPDLYQ